MFIYIFSEPYTCKQVTMQMHMQRGGPPTRPPSAYFIFVSKKRKSLPVTLKLCQVARVLSQMWTSLTPEKRAQYERKATDKLAEYEKDLAAY